MRVSEIFLSVEGEGEDQGIPTIFVRFQGCNVLCKWCDTQYAQSHLNGRDMTVDETVETVKSLSPVANRPRVSLTGGDPLCQDLTELLNLCQRLRSNNYFVHLEHTGLKSETDDQAVIFSVNSVALDIKPPSAFANPKGDYHYWIKNLIFDTTHVYFKAVFADWRDIEFIAQTWAYLKDVKFGECNLFLQPCIPYPSINGLSNKDQIEIADAIRVFTKLHKKGYFPNTRLSCQLHKVLGLD